MVATTRSAARKSDQRQRVDLDGLVCRIVPNAPAGTRTTVKRAVRAKRWKSGTHRQEEEVAASSLSETADSEEEGDDWPLGQYILLFLADLDSYRS